MNKAQLVERVAESTDLSKKAAAELLDAVLENILLALEQGDEVQLVGFGKFKTSVRAERQGRNPQTGEALVIPARTVVVFSPGKELRDAVASI